MSEQLCEAGCGRPALHPCSYEDDEGNHCETAWCDEHIQRVGGIPVCRRHRRTLEIIASRRDTVYELPARPRVADRSLSLVVHLALVLSPAVTAVLERERGAWPGSHVEAEQHPRPFWDAHGTLAGWELGWSIQSSHGHHLRVAVRARIGGEAPSVQVIAEHAVAYEGEPSAEAVRVESSEARRQMVREVEDLLAKALDEVPAGWRRA